MSRSLHKQEGLNGRLSGDGSAQVRRHGGHSEAVTPKCLVPPNFLVLAKIDFKHKTKPSLLNLFCTPKP